MREYSYYDDAAENYDVLEATGNAIKMNENLGSLLKQHKVKTVWDITCGTGAQAIFLHKKGYRVVASDYSRAMLSVAKKKYPKLKFRQADMRNAHLGRFDATISIFNAIGHLTKTDFEKAIRNIRKSLKPGGIYVFDIFNLDYMKRNFIAHEFIDHATEQNGKTYVRFNNNRLDEKKGIMFVNQRTYIQCGNDKPKLKKESWRMQMYPFWELKAMLERNGFVLEAVFDTTGRPFDKYKSSSILVVAKRPS